VTISCGVRQLIDLVGVMLMILTAVQTSPLAKAFGRPEWMPRPLAAIMMIAPAHTAPPSCAGVSGDLTSTLMPAEVRTF
jgi:hypothetical protein